MIFRLSCVKLLHWHWLQHCHMSWPHMIPYQVPAPQPMVCSKETSLSLELAVLVSSGHGKRGSVGMGCFKCIHSILICLNLQQYLHQYYCGVQLDISGSTKNICEMCPRSGALSTRHIQAVLCDVRSGCLILAQVNILCKCNIKQCNSVTRTADTIQIDEKLYIHIYNHHDRVSSSDVSMIFIY